MIERRRLLSESPVRPASDVGRVKPRLVVGLGLLLLLFTLAASLLMWRGDADEAPRQSETLDTPTPSPRGLGTSTLSHGGPAPAEPSFSKRGEKPFLEPSYVPQQESPGTGEKTGARARNHGYQEAGATRASGGRGP